MQAGEIRLCWKADGHLDIRTTLDMTAANKQLVLNVLLDAAKAINGSIPSLITPGAANGARILAGRGT